ncbi:MAG TPA: hypothetical protein VK854_15950 [Woeseiaceae bacterium]|nr:hypothetical protein [Woeseiaceae bacterium]
MRNRLMTALISCLAVSLIAGNAFACGESLFRVGKGVAFRQYTAPLPGTILVVARTESELAMVEQLMAAGHDVHVVADPSLIGQELGKHEFDIVLAYFSQRAEVAAQTAATSVDYLPVTQDVTAERPEAVALYGRSLSSDASVKTFLKTIHRTLKARG